MCVSWGSTVNVVQCHMESAVIKYLQLRVKDPWAHVMQVRALTLSWVHLGPTAVIKLIFISSQMSIVSFALNVGRK